MKKKLWTLALAFCLVSAMLPGGYSTLSEHGQRMPQA